MAHQLPQQQFSTPRIQQRIDFESRQFQPLLFNPNFPPEAGPALAPGDVSTIRYGEIPSDGYSSSPGGGFQLTSPSASGPVPPVGLPLQSYPQSYSQRYQPSIWPPTPHDGQFPNIPSPLAHCPLAPAQAALLGQFQGSHDFMTTFGPTALRPAQVLGVASDIAPEPPQQPRAQVVSQSTPRHPRFRIRIRQKFPSLKISTPRDCNACWKCRNDHKFVRITGPGRFLSRLMLTFRSAALGPPVTNVRRSLHRTRPFPAIAGRFVMSQPRSHSSAMYREGRESCRHLSQHASSM